MPQPYWIGIGDIHSQLAPLARIPGLAEAAGVIVSGDLTNRGGRREAAQVLEAIRRLNPRVWAVIGNMDEAQVLDYLQDEGVSLHASCRELAPGAVVIGVGYSTPTPFGTPSEASEERIGEWLEQALASAGSYDHLLLVCHTPPYKTATDRIGSGGSVGSPVVRAFIERVRPEVVLTGHIHESVAVDQLGESLVVNPGALGAGGYAVIRLTNAGFTAELGAV